MAQDGAVDRFGGFRRRGGPGADAQQRVDPLGLQQVGVGEGQIRRFGQGRQRAGQQVGRRFGQGVGELCGVVADPQPQRTAAGIVAEADAERDVDVVERLGVEQLDIAEAGQVPGRRGS